MLLRLFLFVSVLTMGLLELVVLPLWVGLAADLFSLPLLASTLEARLAWGSANPLSSLALHWGAGSMAVGVVSCLGRELGRALKPNLLPAWVNRPAEQGLEEVLVRMTHDPFLVQMRSFMVSAAAYPAALAVMVMVPAHCRVLLAPLWGSRPLPEMSPLVLGIGEPTQGDRVRVILCSVPHAGNSRWLRSDCTFLFCPSVCLRLLCIYFSCKLSPCISECLSACFFLSSALFSPPSRDGEPHDVPSSRVDMLPFPIVNHLLIVAMR
ncbi:unnamed protein product [Scytosiphon promiscuus]